MSETTDLFEAAVRQAAAAEVRRVLDPYMGLLERLRGAFIHQAPPDRVEAPPPAPTAVPPKVRKANGDAYPVTQTVEVEVDAGEKRCAIIGCTRPMKAIGYCMVHYQKFRNLETTARKPADWKKNAPPQSVKDVVLARGRPAAK